MAQQFQQTKPRLWLFINNFFFSFQRAHPRKVLMALLMSVYDFLTNRHSHSTGETFSYEVDGHSLPRLHCIRMHKFFVHGNLELKFFRNHADVPLCSRIITTREWLQVQIIPNDVRDSLIVCLLLFLINKLKSLCSKISFTSWWSPEKGFWGRRLTQHVIRPIWKAHKEFYFHSRRVE